MQIFLQEKNEGVPGRLKKVFVNERLSTYCFSKEILKIVLMNV